MRATDKIIDALSQLIEGYVELKDQLQGELGAENDIEESEDGIESNPELDAAIVTEVRGAIEAALESADVTPEDFGEVVASLTEALEEIDPDIFEGGSEEESEEEGDDEEDFDDDEIDYDDIDEDEYDDADDEEYEEEEEEEEEDDGDYDDDEESHGGRRKKRR